MGLLRSKAIFSGKIIITTGFLLFLAACAATPNTITFDGTMTLELEPSSEAAIKFGFEDCSNPDDCLVLFDTKATATFDEIDDRFQLNFVEFVATLARLPEPTLSAIADPAASLSVPDILIALDPNVPSTGFVFKLDENGNPFLPHNFIFHLIVTFEGQPLTFREVSLSGITPRIGLDTEVDRQPILLSGGQPATLGITSMTKVLGSDLINGTVTCPCDYDSMAKTFACWRIKILNHKPIFDTINFACNLSSDDGPEDVSIGVVFPNGSCQVLNNNSSCGEIQNTIVRNLTDDETTACLTAVENYTTELIKNDVGVDGSPFVCDTGN